MTTMTDSKADDVLAVMFQLHANNRQMTEADALATAIARLREPAGVGGEWVLVPREPTQAMLDAVCSAEGIEPWTDNAMRSTYVEMLLAAPQPPAEAQPTTWGVLQIGATGSAYDPPDTRRAFTYAQQPGNVLASRLGAATVTAAGASAGDNIDRGLGLLKALQEAGFGVFQLDPAHAEAQAQGGGEVVCWQRRVLLREGHWGQWEQYHDLYDEGRPEKVGRFKCQYRPLYAAPPSAPVGVEGLVAKWRKIAGGESYRPGDMGPARLQQCASELESLALTATYAQQPAAVDGAMVELRGLIEEIDPATRPATGEKKLIADQLRATLAKLTQPQGDKA